MPPSDNPQTPYRYDSEKPPSIAIIEAIAELEETSPVELDFTLYEYIQPDALDLITQSAGVEVAFKVPQYRIRVLESGTVQIS